MSLSDRANEAIAAALKMTNELIQELLANIRTNLDNLFSLTDSVAMLDMLCSFADIVAISPQQFTRPIIKANGPLVIREGRHPIMSARRQRGDSAAAASAATPAINIFSYISNDCYLCPSSSFQVVSGPNGSGKSTYIKQISLLVILAQVGCFVCAAHATIPVRDRLLSLIGTSDDMEHNISTFQMEMREVSYIINNISDKSLVIIDELGRGTSNIDGMYVETSL